MSDNAERTTDERREKASASRQAAIEKQTKVCLERADLQARFTFALACVTLLTSLLVILTGVIFRSSPPIRANESIRTATYWAIVLGAFALVISLIGRFRYRQTRLRCELTTTPPELDMTFDIEIPAVSPPGFDHGTSEHVNSELAALERVARQWANNADHSARHWWLVRYWVGGLAAILAGLGGIGSITKTRGAWSIAIGVLALIGSALVGVITSLNAGKQEEEAREKEIAYRALATRSRLLRSNTPVADRSDLYNLYDGLYSIARQRTQADLTTEPRTAKN